MAVSKGAVVTLLTDLVDSDDEKPRRGKTRKWFKRKRESSYFQNKFQNLKFEDWIDFKGRIRMSVLDYEFLLSQISTSFHRIS